MSFELKGIREKLKRAEENIVNLEEEITVFLLNEGPYGLSIPDSDHEAARQAIAYHLGRKIPERFGVLAGEIIYGLRSSLIILPANSF